MYMMRFSPFAPRRACHVIFAVAVCLGHAAPAHAQLGLPPPALPQSPQIPQFPQGLQTPQLSPTPPRPSDVLGVPSAQAPEPLQKAIPLSPLRAATVRELLRQHADVLEADPAGAPVRRQELLLVSPTPAILDAAHALGFAVLREQTVPELNLRQWVLRPPAGLSTAQGLAQLSALGPQVAVDFNHVYTRAGTTSTRASKAPVKAVGARRIGLVDAGLDRQHPALRGAKVHLWGCKDVPSPSSHGTAVASLLVGRDAAFGGAASGSVLYAADIYCGQPAGGSAENIALALAWMARERVAVVNMSLVGPPNRLLERVIQTMNRQGHLMVAAVGNDGPAAPPLYPAAYPGVVGVTAVSTEQRVLPEAAQGPQVMFAAPGAELTVAASGGGYTRARGTSFAAPLVAGLLAQSMDAPDPKAAASALARLASHAMDLGAPGRDPVFGMGLVGAHCCN